MVTQIRLTGLCTVVVLAACASVPRPEPAANSRQAQDLSCASATGSRITSSEKTCSAGRSYSRADLDRTGAVTADEALRLLDPSVTVHR